MHPVITGVLLPLELRLRIRDRRLRRIPSRSAASVRSRSAVSFACLVAIPAINRPVATRFKRHGSGLSATCTNYRSALCRAGTVACAPLVVLLCLSARLATLWGRKTTFLKERLIGSGEGKVTPAVAALKLNISRHGNPRSCDCTAHFVFSRKNS